MIDKSRFKNAVGAFYLAGMFFEEVNYDKASVVYTLKDEDHLGYPSLYRLYLEVSDPTEYRFAKEHLYSWKHWEMLQECNWFKPYLLRWRKELELKIRSQALVNIIESSVSKTKDAFTANKYLLDANWKGETRAGRPTKEAIKKQAQSIVSDQASVSDDYQRLMKELN